MQLCIDAGNTHIKYAIFKKRRMVHKTISDTFDLTILRGLLDTYLPKRAIISSVRPLPKQWTKHLQKVVPTTILSYKTPLLLKLDYKTPETLGSDRIAAAVGAWHHFKSQNMLIVNAGTCVTFDIVTEKGVYKGGAIAPGIEIRYKALHHFTAKLPFVTQRAPVRITGKSTAESINAGVLNHLCFEVEGAILFYAKHFKNLKVALTGGSSSFLAKRLKSSIFAAPDLVLNGLNEILLYNA